jgi:cell fate (sporulation/competence/biofilm development) regulator YlbF (YheA/YmcA/DUF963 family)
MNTEPMALPASLTVALETLAAALARSEPMAAYHQAQANLEADPASLNLLQLFSMAQSELRLRQTDGTMTPANVGRLRDLQNQVQANPTIMAYARAQQAALAYLPEVNLEISQLLGPDFAAVAGPFGCC